MLWLVVSFLQTSPWFCVTSNTVQNYSVHVNVICQPQLDVFRHVHSYSPFQSFDPLTSCPLQRLKVREGYRSAWSWSCFPPALLLWITMLRSEWQFKVEFIQPVTSYWANRHLSVWSVCEDCVFLVVKRHQCSPAGKVKASLTSWTLERNRPVAQYRCFWCSYIILSYSDLDADCFTCYFQHLEMFGVIECAWRRLHMRKCEGNCKQESTVITPSIWVDR